MNFLEFSENSEVPLRRYCVFLAKFLRCFAILLSRTNPETSRTNLETSRTNLETSRTNLEAEGLNFPESKAALLIRTTSLAS